MNDRSGERRASRYMRVELKGTLRFRGRNYEQHGRIANLSDGGAYVQTSEMTPRRLLRHGVDLELRLDAGSAEWLRTTGHVVRIDDSGVAIAFDQVAAPLLHMINEISATARASSRITSVVLIDADRQRSSAMAAGFRAIGCSVIEAATPLEAIVRLGESSFEPDVIAVADSQSDDAEEMRAFVEREHPDSKLTTIGDEIFEPDGFARWLSSVAPDADAGARRPGRE